MADARNIFPKVSRLPEVDTAAMIEVDRLMMEDYRISLFQMMENAGRCLAVLARVIALGGDARGKQVLALAGGGGNGGGVLTASRRLAAWGADVTIALAQERDRIAPVPLAQLEILERLDGTRHARPEDALKPFDVILDGLIGYSLEGTPGGRTAELIEWANRSPAPTISLDVPSGFDTGSGTPSDLMIQAAATLTIALPKKGMQTVSVQDHFGDLYCADISVPPELYARLRPSLDVPPFFGGGDIVRVGGS